MPSGPAGLARSARKQTYREKGRRAGDSSDLTEGVGEKTERRGRKNETEHSLGAEVFKGIKKTQSLPPVRAVLRDGNVWRMNSWPS